MRRSLFKYFIIAILLSLAHLTPSIAQDYTTWGLPENTIARLGNGWHNDMAYAPDGNHIAIASSVGVWIYDSQTGKKLNLLTTTTGNNHLWRMAFSPDPDGPIGPMLAASSYEGGNIYVWDYETSTHMYTFQAEPERVQHLTFSLDGNILASTTTTTTLWDVRTGTKKNKLIGPNNEHFSVRFNSDGQTLTSVGPVGVRLWNIETGTIQQTLFKRYINNPQALSPDGLVIALGDRTRIYLWDVATGTQIQTFREHTGWTNVAMIAFSPDGGTLASGGQDRTIRLWDVETGTRTHTFSGHTDDVAMIAFSPDGGTLASGGQDRTIRLWDVETRSSDVETETRGMVFTNNIGFFSPTFSPDGGTLAMRSQRPTHGHNVGTKVLGSTIHLWEVSTGTDVRTISGHESKVYSLAFSSDSQILASSGENVISLWDVRSETLIRQFEERGIGSLAFSPNGQLLISTGGRSISLYEVATGNLRYSMDLPRHPWVADLKFTSNDTFTGVVLVDRFFSWNAHVYSWDVATATAKRLNEDRISGVNPPFARSSNGLTLAAQNGPSNVEWIGVWNIPTGKELYELHGHTEPPSSLAFSPDGQTLASGSHDHTIRLWDVATGTEMYTLREHHGSVFGLAFSPDGLTLASTSIDGTVLLWDMQNFPRRIPRAADINNDNTVNIQDLVILGNAMGAANKGDIDTLLGIAASIAYLVGDVTREINELKKPFDLNNDGKINILDLVILAAEMNNPPNAPSLRSQIPKELTPGIVSQWVTEAKWIDQKTPTYQRGLRFLQQLLVAFTLPPKETALLANYPNPFNPETWIPYQLANPANVTLTIYDIQGHVVRNLDLGPQRAGMYHNRNRAAYWDGKNAVSEPVASGLYFYTLTAGDFTATRKMLIRK